uniref:NADH-ubiquinone oxidoreductase chain 2 n=1 Tax=Rhizophagus aeneus TaxID=1586534 RepID=A0A343C3L8_9CUCU|nr:NADH dehydrogenase subunit 2 [Rhizophagus aeneus]
MLFFNSMILGTLISISSYSWMSMWMGLEINLLSIIPLMNSHKNIYPAESALKYFLTQALASMILLFSIIMMMNMNEFIPLKFNIFFIMIMNSSLLTKMGAAPFHFWFPEVMEGLNWMNNLILLTWQKIAPMILMIMNMKFYSFLIFIIIISSMIGSIMGLNQLSLRKIMAYSSINHISWMLSSLFNNQSIWFFYFMIYSIITINIILIFNQLNSFYLKQFINSMNYNKMIKFFFILNFLSLGGLPPFLGFFPKWMIINNLITQKFYFLTLILIIFTLLTLFFYIRIIFSVLMLNSTETIIFNKKINNFTMMFLNLISISSLLLILILYNLT